MEKPTLLNEIIEEVSVGSFGFEYDDGKLIATIDFTESEEILKTNIIAFRAESLFMERYIIALDKVSNRNA